ncbi:MAG TPA: pseudouridine synthase [Edaphocola sp.]|nr:pseudouridine synthase [Edaphocola sp.]
MHVCVIAEAKILMLPVDNWQILIPRNNNIKKNSREIPNNMDKKISKKHNAPNVEMDEFKAERAAAQKKFTEADRRDFWKDFDKNQGKGHQKNNRRDAKDNQDEKKSFKDVMNKAYQERNERKKNIASDDFERVTPKAFVKELKDDDNRPYKHTTDDFKKRKSFSDSKPFPKQEGKWKDRIGKDDRTERKEWKKDDNFEKKSGDRFERGDRNSDKFERKGNDRFEKREGGYYKFEKKSGDKFERGDRNSDKFDRKGNDRFEKREGGFNKFEKKSGERFERGDRNSDKLERKGNDRFEKREGGYNKFEKKSGDRFERGDRNSEKMERKGNDRFEKREGGFNNFENKVYKKFDKDSQNYSESKTKNFVEKKKHFKQDAFLTHFDNEQPDMKVYDHKGKQGVRAEQQQTANMEIMPLNKFIAHCGICSRRDAVELIKAGKIKVNEEVILEPGYKVQEEDQVSHEGNAVKIQKKLVYVLLNKPKGFITTTDDPKGRRTVMDILGEKVTERVFPIGRLDRNTTGLLLLTNDGDLAQNLSHPKYENRKIYQVTLDKKVNQSDFDKILAGLELEDGLMKVDQLAFLEKKNEIGIEIHSGKNRIVRRIFEHLGYVVEKLDRVMYAGLTKKNLKRGQWRFLTNQEIINIKHLKG